MKKDRDCRIIRLGDRILRILDAEAEKVLVIDCVKMGMPKWISLSEIEDGVEIPGEEFMGEMERDIPEGMSASARQTMHERFTVISGILPCVGDKKQRSLRIADAAEKYKVSQNTVKNYLGLYLAYQDISVLAPREKQEQRELTQDEKNMRWALNKFYYTREKQSLSTVYTLMLKERYCDRNGKLKDRYPSIHQLRYFYKKTKKLQTYYISRNGLKDYQRNHRPLLGDGVQEFCSVGAGMLDGTVCDIYLVDDAGHLVGRPILLACVDAYTSFCYGYSLLWEGGVYSLRNLMLNVAADKKEWCRRFGILIEREQWDCDCLPGLMLTDMGTEYTSENFGQITELGVTIQNLPAYRPELKGQVEKFFDLIQSEYKKHLKGRGVIEPDYRERGAHDYRKDAVQIQAIEAALQLYHEGRLNQQEAQKGCVETETIYRAELRPLTRRKKGDKCFVYSIYIRWNPGAERPIEIEIVNFYAPVVKTDKGLLNVLAKEKTDEVRNRFSLTIDQWCWLEHILEANIRTFENEHSGSLYRMAEEEKKRGMEAFRNSNGAA